MKLFGTDGIRGKAGIFPITEEVARLLGKAIVTLVASEGAPRIIVARDTRASGVGLESALVAGIVDAGGEALMLGILPSNAVSFAILREHASAGVMISASHNPAEDNGLKFFNREGFKLSGEQEAEMEALLSSKKFSSGKGKESILGDYTPYLDFLAGNGNLAGLRIGVDAGNGAASFIVKDLFRQLGADAIVINNNPDGSNINADCGAMFPGKLQALIIEKKLNAGIALDGDADRLVLVDETGKVVDGDAIIGIAALHLKSRGKLASDTIVVTDYSNSGLDESLEKAGITTLRVKTGDKHVSEALFGNGYSIGGENSGHIIFTGLSKTADALLAAVQVLQAVNESGKKLSALAAAIQKYPQVLLNVDVREKRDISSMPEVASAIAAGEKALGQGRVFIRYSGTESKLRILVEGKSETQIKEIAERIAKAVRSEIGK